MSVVEITSTKPYDEMGIPLPNSINDPRMGTNMMGARCHSCNGSTQYIYIYIYIYIV